MTQVPVKEIMTKEVVTVPPMMLVREVAKILSERNITGVPVTNDEGHVLGVVSELDIVSRQGATAADIMSKQVITVTEETDIDEVVHLFQNRRIRRVPVLSGGRLVGIVSRSDLLQPASISHFLPDDQNFFDADSDPC